MTDIITRKRQQKALAMVAEIDAQFHRQFPRLDAHDQAGRILLASQAWTDDMWLRIAQRAGYVSKKTPGPTTRGLVADIYRGRATAPIQQQRAS